jgi:hypothetical protein
LDPLARLDPQALRVLKAILAQLELKVFKVLLVQQALLVLAEGAAQVPCLTQLYGIAQTTQLQPFQFGLMLLPKFIQISLGLVRAQV